MMEAMGGRGGHEESHRAAGVGAPGRVSPGPGSGAGAVAVDLVGDPSEGEVRLSSRPESAATARRLTVEVLCSWGLGEMAETGELLVSELVGNAVRHTGARTFGLRIDRRRGWVRVEVRDPSRALPCLVPVVRDLDESGRGLFLVDTMSDRWGVDLLPRGKTTWFELRTPQ